MNSSSRSGICFGRWLLGVLAWRACEVAAAAGGEETSIYSTAYLVQVLGALLLVFGCLFGLLFLLKRVHGIPTTERKDINVVGSLKVGAREKILLVRADDHQLLVGVAAGSIRTLYVYHSKSQLTAGNPVHSEDFSSLLGSLEGST